MGKQSRREGRRARKKTEVRPEWASLEAFARLRIQGWLQDLLEEEVTQLLGRQKSERCVGVDATAGYRNGYGKPRRVAMMLESPPAPQSTPLTSGNPSRPSISR